MEIAIRGIRDYEPYEGLLGKGQIGPTYFIEYQVIICPSCDQDSIRRFVWDDDIDEEDIDDEILYPESLGDFEGLLTGLEDLFNAPVPGIDLEEIARKVESARTKFRRPNSSADERMDAIRDLVAVLESLRPRIKQVLNKKDEDDLFNIANNFGIRHDNAGQRTNYDKNIWYWWMFFYYLITIHVVVRLLQKHEAGES